MCNAPRSLSNLLDDDDTNYGTAKFERAKQPYCTVYRTKFEVKINCESDDLHLTIRSQVYCVCVCLLPLVLGL